MKPKNFIVPHDFTNVADIALEHAIATAKPLGAEIYLLHVVGKNKDINAAEAKLENVVTGYKTDVKIIPSVRVGNIFEDIGDFAAEHHAELIFMGTHGTHGWQHLTGMNALKVITHSTVPFVIVQDKTAKETGYDSIVLPLDLNKETKQKLAIVANIAKYFDSKVHVITPEEKDEFLNHKVTANIQFAKKYYLIAIMNLNKNNVLGVLTASHEEYIITNDAKIPVLIVNPIEGLSTLAVDFN